jgi:hypothetical protein
MRLINMFTKSKITISGNIIETYDFEKEIWHGPLPQQKKLSRKHSVRSKKGKRNESSFYRSKNKLKHLIDANAGQWGDKKLRPRFVTLTFKENVTDIKRANSEHTKFIQKLNYHLKLKKENRLAYVAVIEFQKRGAVHYHTLFFNLPFIPKMYDKMEALWGNGFVISKKIDKVQHLSSYVCKYMGKELNDERLYGQKCYFASMNLKKPRTIYNESAVRFVAEFMPEEIKPYEKIIQRDHCGIIAYRRYDMSKHEEIKKTLLDLIK